MEDVEAVSEAAAVEAAAVVTVAADAVEVEATAAAAVEVAETEERAEAQVGVVLARDMKDPEVPWVCGCAMKHICPPCTFGTGKNCTPLW